MKLWVLLIAFIFVLWGCGNHSSNQKLTVDSLFKDSVKKKKAIDSEMKAAERPDSLEANESLENESADAIKEYINNYNKVKKIDSLIVDGDDSLEVHLKYYCLHDNSLVIPKKFNWWQHPPKDKRINDFATSVVIEKNNHIIINKIILRSDFQSLAISEPVKKYGELFDRPGLKYNRSKKLFIIGFSFSIPGTDLGEAVHLIVDKMGNYQAEGNTYMFQNKLDETR